MPLRFDQIQEGPQDPFCANAQGNVEEDHRTTKKRRIHRDRAADEERTNPGLTIGMFLAPIPGQEEGKKEEPHAGAYL